MTQQHPEPTYPTLAGKPDNYLAWAILSTILCCVPLGAVSIVQSVKVDKLWAAGDHEQARRASASARKWAIASAASSAVFLVLWLGLMILGVALGGVA